MSATVKVHPLTGEPKSQPASRQDLFTLSTPVRPRRSIDASYDAARDTDEFKNYWANADSFDADSANSKAVRQKLVNRSRYEAANNGYVDGILQTFANFLVGVGPKLRMLTGNAQFNQAVETVWQQWAKKIKLRRKLWVMAHAKMQDGESFAVVRTNTKIKHPVKLDIVPFETEQCQSLTTFWGTPDRIDGIKFDEFGNPETYEVLRYHPGGQWFPVANWQAEEVPAKYMLHWFMLRRPNQHRGVPELRSTLNVGASSRRYREATVAAAETVAEMGAVLLKTDMPPGEADPASPFSGYPMQRRMITAMPAGWDAMQMKPEHPTANYSEFVESQIGESARPKNMPLNIAMCNSSKYNYASGRLDHQTFFASLDSEREDGNDLVLDQLFELFWEEAVLAYGWNADPENQPAHGWDWPKHPVADRVSDAEADDIQLKNGSKSLRRVVQEGGDDLADEIPQMAEDYGQPEEKVREAVFHANFNAQNQLASIAQANNAAATAGSA